MTCPRFTTCVQGYMGPYDGRAMQHLTWKNVTLIFCILLLLILDAVECTGGRAIGGLQRQAFRNLRSTECKIDCSNVRRRPVCGSDGITYSSRCEIRRVKSCEGINVKVKKKGECSGPGSKKGSRCIQEREEARAVARRPMVGIFIPVCNEDGTYAETQCHAATGYCWCATPDGKPLPGTSASNKKPDCKGKPKRSKGNKKGKRRGCSQTDRSTFNKNLIAVFTEEYNRIANSSHVIAGLSSKTPADSVLNTPDKRVVEWKFSELDKDSDNRLRKKEVRSLKRMVKKLIKPRACAKSFVNYCDLDQDRKIIRREWSLCLGVDINRSNVFKSHVIKSYGLSSLLRPSTSDDSVEERPSPTSHREPAALPSEPSLWDRQLFPPKATSTQEPIKTDNTEELRSCDVERQAAIKTDKEDPEGKIFIPSCSPDGKYTKAQCHKSTQYCWCVEEENGRPIPGTSTHIIEPSCDMKEERQMKGCPHSQKRRFLKDLVDHLTAEMDKSKAADKSTGLSATNRDKAFYQGVVKWKLNQMDENNNSMLERKEWKNFKKEVRNTVGKKKALRKCARNFLRYCDEDKNKKISVDEWVECTGVNRNMYSLPPNPKRKGPNPFIGQLCC